MAPSNLHTLDNDVLCEILIACPDLTALRGLILTHPALYHAFNGRRRLIVRNVFRAHYNVTPQQKWKKWDIQNADELVGRLKSNNPTNNLAFREAFWPELERQLPSASSCKWAASLLACYIKSGLKDHALSFARRSMGICLDTSKPFGPEARAFARAVLRTYAAEKLTHEGIELQKKTLGHINSRLPEHGKWAKQLITAYRNDNDHEAVLRLQLDIWELYKSTLPLEGSICLDWARLIICEYQQRGDDLAAMQFHEDVRTALDTTTAQYVAWSRQGIRMHKKAGRIAEALVVLEDVWHRLHPDSKVYRAWTAELNDMYEAFERRGDAIAICEAVWTDSLRRTPTNTSQWRFRVRTAGYMLAKAYRRDQRLGDAGVVEAKCRELEDDLSLLSS